MRLLYGDFDSAAEALQIAMGLEADRPSVRFLLGLVRIGQRRVDEALALMKDVPASDPYYAMAQAQLKKLQRKRKIRGERKERGAGNVRL